MYESGGDEEQQPQFLICEEFVKRRVSRNKGIVLVQQRLKWKHQRLRPYESVEIGNFKKTNWNQRRRISRTRFWRQRKRGEQAEPISVYRGNIFFSIVFVHMCRNLWIFDARSRLHVLVFVKSKIKFVFRRGKQFWRSKFFFWKGRRKVIPAAAPPP